MLLMWKWIGQFLRKNHLLRCWDWLSLLNWIRVLRLSLGASKKIGALICSMKFFSPEVALYQYKSTIWPCLEYCCHVWAGAPSCYLELLDKLHKQICKTFGPSLAAPLECLVFSTGITLVDIHLNSQNWFHFIALEVDLLVILIDCMIFLSPFLDVTRMSISTVSFLPQLDSRIL